MPQCVLGAAGIACACGTWGVLGGLERDVRTLSSYGISEPCLGAFAGRIGIVGVRIVHRRKGDSGLCEQSARK